MSMTQPGIFFTINDSGNEPLLFALDTAGHDRGVWRIPDANNVDWEAAAVGPCSAGAAAWCVYIGDVGDNEARRRSRKIYRVAEPRALSSGGASIRSGRATHLRLSERSPGCRSDVRRAQRRCLPDREASAARCRAPTAARTRVPYSGERMAREGAVDAELADSLPIVPGSAPFRLITDAALSPDAKHLAVRTYMQLYVFDTDSASGRVNHEIAPTVCNLLTVDEAQGEGLTWADNRGRFVFTTEGRRAPIALADCPVPR